MAMGLLKGYKTYIVAGITIVSAVGACLAGDTSITDALQLIIPAILSMTIRHGITTEANK